MKYRILLFYIALLFSTSFVSGQYYDTGEDPASLKWLQIKTKRFTVIYPESFGAEGIKYARSLDDSYSKLTSLYSIKKVRIPVIIHNYTTFSNGYVAWAPRRIEIYPTPEQNTIPLDPVEQLTTHELTHVLQMYSMKKGFSNIMTWVLGEQFTGAVSALIPMWFMEGDAVFAESVLSGSGRGRAPTFQKQLKAIDMERHKMYSFDKMVIGSFKNYTPDHYQYGYQMTAWSYAKYDPQMWNKTLEYASRYPFTIVPVNISLKKIAGLTKAKLFSETFDSLKTLWQKNEAESKAIQYEAVNPSKKGEYVNYYSPVIVGKDSLVAIKTSLYDPPSFVLINTREKSEKRIKSPGNMGPWFLSGSNGKIVWVEEHPDPRWENRNFSVILIKDLHHNKTVQLSRNSRFMAASISPDGKLIVAVENTIDNKNSLVIVDAVYGFMIDTLPLPGNVYPQRPQWSASGDEITIISLSGKGEGIMSYSLKTKSWQTLIEEGREDLQSSFLRNDSLFFVSSASGTDNIYVLSQGRKISKLTNSRFGAYDLFADGNTVYFADYSSSGNNISKVQLDQSSVTAPVVNSNESFLINRFDTMKYKSSDSASIDYIPQPYRKWKHLFKFHSWMPFYADIEQIQADPTAITPGFTLMTQNNLSTVISTIGYEYTNNKNMFHSRITWKGWVPVFESQIDYGDDPSILKLNNSVADPVNIQPALRFINTVSIPLSFSSGKFSQYVRVSFSSTYYNRYIYLKENGIYDHGQTQLTGRFYISNYQISALRDIYPRWAQVFDYFNTFSPADKTIYGPVSTLKTAFYFPGVLKNQSIKLRYESEVQKPGKLILYNRASFPRSYKNIISEDLKFFSADYTMPLLYPDLTIPGIFYVKRIRGGLFYDYAQGSKNRYITSTGTVFHNYTETFRSFGFELLSDFYLLRIPFMISGGVQTSWKSFNESPSFEILLQMNIFGTAIGANRSPKSL